MLVFPEQKMFSFGEMKAFYISLLFIRVSLKRFKNDLLNL